MMIAGSSFRRISGIAGVNEATIARRISKISKRLMDATYITCLRNSDILGEKNVQIACDLLVRGMSHRQIARRRDISLYRVRKAIAEVSRFARKGEV